MSESTQYTGLSFGKELANLLLDPRLYFTIALFAGEAGPEFFKSSGWMYIFTSLGIYMLLMKRKLETHWQVNIIFWIYAVVLIRNITFNNDILFYYEIPNFVTALLLYILSCIFFKEEDIERIEEYIFIYAAILAALGVLKFVQNPSERLAVFGGPNGYYKIALLFEVLCFYRFQARGKRIYLAGAVVGLILCIATGSKGGIVSMAGILSLEVLFYLFNAGRNGRLIISRLVQIVIILAIGIYLISHAIDKIPGLSGMIARANIFLYGKSMYSLTSVSARTNLYSLGIQFFKESPIIGKGARYTYFYTNGVQPYPHNIFIEFLSENGIIGTIPLLLFFLKILVETILYGLKDSHYFCLALCLAVYLSGSLFSGNILDAKIIFVFGILIFNYTYNKLHCRTEEILP